MGRFEDAASLLRQTIPVARRVLGETCETTLRMLTTYTAGLCSDASATREEQGEAVDMLEDTERIARRVFGAAHPLVTTIEECLANSRALLRARAELPG